MIINRHRKKIDKIHLLFLIKTLSNRGIEVNFLIVIKRIYEKPTANIILKGDNT